MELVLGGAIYFIQHQRTAPPIQLSKDRYTSLNCDLAESRGTLEQWKAASKIVYDKHNRSFLPPSEQKQGGQSP
jgi:hypothetical protein